MDGLTLNHVTHITPSFAASVTDWVQRCLPCRLKGIHIVNQPFIFNMVYAIFKPFLLVRASTIIYQRVLISREPLCVFRVVYDRKPIFISSENFLDRMKIRNSCYLSRLIYLHALKVPLPVERKVRSRHKKFDDHSLINFASNVLNLIFSYLNEKKIDYDGISKERLI